MTYWTGCASRSCFNCINAIKHKPEYNYPNEPDEPAYTECECKEVDDELFNHVFGERTPTEEELAEKCGHYSPVMLNSKCPQCGEELRGTEFQHTHWASWDSFTPCCSEECVKSTIKELERYEMGYAD